VSAVRQLQAQFPSTQLDPGEIAIRAHEITEDAIEFALTGRDDYGSHSALATVRADLDATSTVLALVRSLLAPRYAALPALDAQLRRAAADVEATRTGGGYPALDRLPRAARERIDADLGALAETLAPVAAILEPRRTS
jgi:iron uptake system component EfeO